VAGSWFNHNNTVGFLRALFAQLAATLGGYLLEFRMDGAFFRRDILALLERYGAEYAIKVPFYPWVGLKERLQQTRAWTRVDETVSWAAHHVAVAQWGRAFRVVVYRKRVHHQTAKNFQLDLFDPADGHYEYSAVVTNKPLSGPALWAFMCGRGAHEKAYAELKSGFAFDCVPTMRYAANSLWQLLSVLAFNLVRGFQVLTTADRRGRTRKRVCGRHWATPSDPRGAIAHRATSTSHHQRRRLREATTHRPTTAWRPPWQATPPK